MAEDDFWDQISKPLPDASRNPAEPVEANVPQNLSEEDREKYTTIGSEIMATLAALREDEIKGDEWDEILGGKYSSLVGQFGKEPVDDIFKRLGHGYVIPKDDEE